MSTIKKQVLTIAFCFLLLCIDQIVKLGTLLIPPMNYFGGYPYGGIGVFKDFLGIEFSLVHATNIGAAWSLFSSYSEALLFVRIVLIVVLAYLLFTGRLTNSPNRFASKLPWLLIFSGAVSNVIDHFIYGHVIDTFHFILWGYDYPVFNVADMCIFFGALLLVLKQGNFRVATSKN